jgi:hypothetical protein
MPKLTCHCGCIEAEISVPINELAKIVKCNCSICKRKSATMGMVKNEDFKITKGEDKLKLYQYHTKVAKHYFLLRTVEFTLIIIQEVILL